MLESEIVKNLHIVANIKQEALRGFFDIGMEIWDTSKTNAKKQLLRGVPYVLSEEEGGALFNLMFNNFYRYGITVDYIMEKTGLDIDLLLEAAEEKRSSSFPELFKCLASYVAGDLTKTEFCEEIKQPLIECNDSILDTFFAILNQDWGNKISATTVNNVFPGTVSVFNITRATDLPIEDIESLEGEFIMELKMDGTRDYLVVSPNPQSDKDIYCLSRNGRLLDVPEATKDILRMASNHPGMFTKGLVLDGELTIKDSVLSEDRTSITGIHNSAISKKAGKNSKLQEGWSKDVSFNAFDILTYDEFFNELETGLVLERKAWLQEIVCSADTNCIKLMQYETITLPRDMDKVTDYFWKLIEEGSEGIILKDIEYEYSFNKEYSGWYKIKDVKTCTLRVVGYTLSDDPNLVGGLGALVLHTEDGLMECKAGSGLSFEQRGFKGIDIGTKVIYEPIEGYDIEDWVGLLVEVKYFGLIQAKDKELPSLFLPRFVRVRDDKTEAYTVDEL